MGEGRKILTSKAYRQQQRSNGSGGRRKGGEHNGDRDGDGDGGSSEDPADENGENPANEEENGGKKPGKSRLFEIPFDDKNPRK